MQMYHAWKNVQFVSFTSPCLVSIHWKNCLLSQNHTRSPRQMHHVLQGNYLQQCILERSTNFQLSTNFHMVVMWVPRRSTKLAQHSLHNVTRYNLLVQVSLFQKLDSGSMVIVFNFKFNNSSKIWYYLSAVIFYFWSFALGVLFGDGHLVRSYKSPVFITYI